MTEIKNEKERLIKGISANSGIAIGEIFCVDNKKRKVLPTQIGKSEVDVHLNLFSSARKELLNELSELLDQLDSNSSAIIETQKQIILDSEIERRVSEVVKEQLLSCEFAIYKTFCDFIERLKESGSELFQQRIVDLENLRDRLLELVSGEDASENIKEGSIVIAGEISPVELVNFHEQGLVGLVMEKSGVTSHASLIAQSLGIPCIVNSKNATEKVNSGIAILDGREGRLILNPSEKSLAEYKKLLRKIEEKEARLIKSLSAQSTTRSGTKFNLSSNVEFESELEILREYKINNIGLLRTEGLLFKGKTSIDEQFNFYKSVIESVSGEVIFRLFDVGGDKLSLGMEKEANPFLGWRGIRMLLDETELLKNQLRALLTVAGLNPGRVKILVPMISMEEEVIKINEIINEVQSELISEGVSIDKKVQIGAMIEVPSAAINAENLANHLDFMSIGTNDLTQYTLAVDRGNEKICSLYQQQHPSIWKLIQFTSEAAKKTNTPLTVCGELAGDVLGACGLMGLGINNLSMLSTSIPKVKEELISHSDEEFHQLAVKFLSAKTTIQIKEIFEDWRNY